MFRRPAPGWTVGRLLTLGFLVAVLTLLVVGGSAYFQIRQLVADQVAVSRADAVSSQIDLVLSTVKDAETGQRGFVITGRETYAQLYQHRLHGRQHLLQGTPDPAAGLETVGPGRIAQRLAPKRTPAGSGLGSVQQLGTMPLRTCRGGQPRMSVRGWGLHPWGDPTPTCAYGRPRKAKDMFALVYSSVATGNPLVRRPAGHLSPEQRADGRDRLPAVRLRRERRPGLLRAVPGR